MSEMDEALRELLRRKADEMTSHRDVPPALLRRTKLRIARNSLGAAAIALVLIAGGFTGFRAFAGASGARTAGSPPPVVQRSHSPRPHPSTQPTPTPTPSPSSSAGAQTASRCRLSQLQIQFAGSGGAAGSIRVKVSMRNTSSSTCSLEGYPGMALLAGTKVLHTDVVRGSSVVVPPIGVRLVTLAPGALASYVFGYSDVPTSQQGCPASDGLEVTPPNAYGHATISLQATACGGVLTTSPVFSGTRVPSS